MRWLARFAERTHILLFPGVWVAACLAYYAVVVSASEGEPCCWNTDAHLWGAILVYSLTPAYLIGSVTFLWFGTREAITELLPCLPAGSERQIDRLPEAWLSLAGVLGGTAFALIQFSGLFGSEGAITNPWLDLSMVGGNVLVWSTVGWLGVQRLHAAMVLNSLAARVVVDLYDPAALQPFARICIRNVLVIMGALAIMPLQSLDAVFRLDNYIFGLLFGLPMAAALFLLPLLPVRHRIQTVKSKRLAELQAAIGATERSAIGTLESLAAHRERIRQLPAWPLDLSLVSRVAFYLIIPPLAWVGAALVETLVQGFLG